MRAIDSINEIKDYKERESLVILDMDDDTQLLNPKQVAEILGIHQKTVHLWLRSGRLKGTKISYRAWRIPRSALNSFIESNSNLSKQSPNVTNDTSKESEREIAGENLSEKGSNPSHNKMKYYIRDIMGEHPRK
jgi:excisionase family DNA binding protein